MQSSAQAIVEVLLAAVLPARGHGGLRQCTAADVLYPLKPGHLGAKAARQYPPGAVAWRQRFGMRGAVQHQAFGVVGLASAGTAAAKIKLAVNIIFYQRNVVLC